MKKKTILYLLLDLIFLAIFNLIFFLVGGSDHPTSVWLSYGFIHFAYIMLIITPVLTRKCSNRAIMGFPLYVVSSTYFLFEFVVGLVFILIGNESHTVALIVQVIMLGIYALLLIPNLIANEQTAESVERHEREVAYIKEASSRVRCLVDKMSDKGANRAVEAVYDLLHSSPTRSHPTVKIIEEEIINKVADLDLAVSSNDISKVISISKEVIAMIEERNRKLKLYQ